jgi:hypothetical protein
MEVKFLTCFDTALPLLIVKYLVDEEFCYQSNIKITYFLYLKNYILIHVHVITEDMSTRFYI